MQRLNIGNVYATRQDETLACIGLGSCVAVFLHDRQRKIGGGAHIFLPEGKESETMTKTHFVEGALSTLKSNLLALGAQSENLRAFVFGGAALFSNVDSVGPRNVKAVNQWLTKNKIFVALLEVGGTRPMSVSFQAKTGIPQRLNSKLE